MLVTLILHDVVDQISRLLVTVLKIIAVKAWDFDEKKIHGIFLGDV